MNLKKHDGVLGFSLLLVTNFFKRRGVFGQTMTKLIKCHNFWA